MYRRKMPKKEGVMTGRASNQNCRAKTEADVPCYTIDVYEHEGRWGYKIVIVAFKQPLVIASAQWNTAREATQAGQEQHARICNVSRKRRLLKKSANNYNKSKGKKS
jgi:hypothetical protein